MKTAMFLSVTLALMFVFPTTAASTETGVCTPTGAWAGACADVQLDSRTVYYWDVNAEEWGWTCVPGIVCFATPDPYLYRDSTVVPWAYATAYVWCDICEVTTLDPVLA